MSEENNKGLKLTGIVFVLLIVVAGASILFAMMRTQWVDGKEWRERAARRVHDLQTIPAQRGNIYSSDGKILASTIPVCDFYLDLGRARKQYDQHGNLIVDEHRNPVMGSLIVDSNYTLRLDSICDVLAEATGKPAQYFHDRINTEKAKDRPSRCFLVQRGIPYSAWMRICQFKGWREAIVKQVDGRSVIRKVRAHTYGNLAENTIGFRNQIESDTYTGLEGYYDELLRGQDGQYMCRRLTMGVWLPVEEGGMRTLTLDQNDTSSITIDSTQVRPVVDGSHIVSTIDTRFQDIAETSLRRVLTRHGGQSGCAILMEIETGYVLACSSLTFDTASKRYMELPNANVAVSSVYEPGSTFKTVILTAMMTDTTIHIDTAMRVQVGQKTFPCTQGYITDDRSHNRIDSASVAMVMAKSSNVGMCELGWKYYRNRRPALSTLVRNIFPYDVLNVDVRANESKASIVDLERSYRDFLNFCFGYATMVSPLQVLTFYNAIGGNGRMVKPLFCREIITGTKHLTIKPVVLKEKIASDQTLAIMKNLLVGVVERGTGDNIKNNTYGIAGKTGTAFHNYQNTTRYNASFAGFFPVENPKYSCLVVVNDIPAYGRNTAVVFKDIADCVVAIDKKLGNISMDKKIASLKKNPEDTKPHVVKAPQLSLMQAYQTLRVPYVTTDSSAIWAVFEQGVDSLHRKSGYYPYTLPQGQVPNCQGMTVRDAIALLHQMGYGVKFSGVGKVVRQFPSPRTKLAKGNTVSLELEN
ncbi:MAG: transpeptidase family protein [Bacteroidales bacterium]|nr:transpeptidase family protein [Bacteroidales bacterium]